MVIGCLWAAVWLFMMLFPGLGTIVLLPLGLWQAWATGDLVWLAMWGVLAIGWAVLRKVLGPPN